MSQIVSIAEIEDKAIQYKLFCKEQILIIKHNKQPSRTVEWKHISVAEQNYNVNFRTKVQRNDAVKSERDVVLVSTIMH